MLRNVNVLKTASVLMLFITGLCKTAGAQAPVAGIDANDTIVCVGNTISFTDISVPGGAAITGWDWTFGDGGSSAAQNPVYAYTVGGNYTVQLIVTDANGNKDTATQDIFVLLAQAINNTIRICSPQSSTTIIAVDPGIPGVTGAWFTASSGVIATPGNDTTVISNLISGTYLFFWVVTDGTCSDADQVTVIVDQPVTVNAGPDQQICSAPGTATMAASNPAPGTGIWTTTSSAIIANPSNRNTTVSGMTTAGTYTFVWTVTNGSCVTRDTMQIVVTTPISPNAGTDQSVCSTPGTATLSGSSPAPGTGVWTTTSSAGITTPASASSAVTGLTSAGTYPFIWTITNGACVRRDTMNIVVTALVTANAGADVQVCTSVGQGTITAANPAPGTGVWTAVTSGTIVSPNSPGTLVTGLGTAGTYQFVWTVTNGPCVSRDTVAIVVSSPVTPNAGSDQQLCSTTTATLTGSNPSPGSGLWTTTGTAVIAAPASATTTVSNLSTGNNTFIYSISLGACVNRDTVIIRVDSAIAANAGPDQTICETTSTITMAANTPAPGTGVWTKLNGGTITTPSSPVTTITGLTSGVHQFVWTITNGACVRRDTMRVTVNVQIPSNAGIDLSICQGSTTTLSGNNPAPATGLWSTTSSAIIATPASPNTGVSGFSSAGVYPFVWTVTNGACVRRDTVRITVDSSIVATTGPNQNICAASTATLAGNAPATGSGLWTTTGTAVITSPSVAASGVTALAYGNNTFVWTITNGSCISRDTVVIRRDSVVTATAGPDQNLCSTTGTATMAANTPSSGNGLWTTTSTAVIATPSSPTTAISGLTTAGTYTFVWTITNGACVSRDTILITVSAAVVANAGSDQTLCNVTSATLAGSNPAPGTGLWTSTSSAVITSPASAGSTITGLQSGNYVLVWTVTNGACTSRDTVSVRIDSLVTSSAGPDQQVCTNTIVTMSANSPGLGSGQWTALNGGTVTSPSNAATTITGLSSAGVYNFVWTITNGACISRDTVQISVASPVVANAGSDQTLCNVTSATLTGSNPAPGTGSWTTTSTATISAPSNATTGVTGLTSGSFTFVWTITNGSCTTRDTTVITIDSLVTANAGSDQQLCAGSIVNLLANIPAAGSGSWTAVTGGTITNPTNPATTISGLTNSGTYDFVWTITNGSCVSRDTISITVDSLVVATAGSDQQLCGTTTTVLVANPAAPGSGLWTTTSSASITTPANENTGVSDLFTGSYTFVWTITNGACISSDSVEVVSDSLEAALAGSDQIICSGSTLALSANTPTLGIGIWANPDGGTISNSNDANATITDLLNAGTYMFIWTIVNGSCISADTMYVTVDSLVAAGAGADQFLCENFNTILSGNVINQGSGIWTTSGSALLALDTDPNSLVSNLAYGVNEFIWTVTNGTCISSDTVMISVDSLIAALAGSDQQICQGTTLALTGNTPVSGIGQWDAPDGGTIANSNAPSTTVTDLNNAGTYQFIWNIFNGACSASDTLVVQVDSLDLAAAGPDQTICESAAVTTMAANAPLFGTGTWTTTSAAVIDNVNSPITLISGLTAGTYDFVWTIVNGSCTSADTVTIVVSPLASPANAGSDQQACAGTGILLSGNVPVVGTGTWTSTGPAVVDTAGVVITTASGLITGVNTFIYTITSGACSASDTMEVTIFPLPVADAGVDQFVTSGTLVTLGGTPAASGGTGSYTYAWSPSAGINDTTLANPTITVNSTSTFLLLVTDSLGCTSLDSITIWVNNPPDAQPDTAVTWEDTAVVVFVLNNDNDPDNNIDSSSVTVTAGPFNGTVVIGAGGVITYTPNPDFYGVDSLFYTVCDSGIPVYCDSAWVYFNISPVNDPPVALNDTATTVEDSCIQIAVLVNDSDVENMIDVLTLTILNGPANGTITLDTLTGVITYCPDSNFVGTDTLVYMICDSGFPAPGLCDTALVIITVNPLNDIPVAVNDTAFACSGDVVFIPALANDYDPEGDTLSLTITIPPLYGNVVLTPTQELVYSSNPGASGWDSLQYVVCDQQSPAGCDTAWVYFYVHPLAQLTATVSNIVCAGDSTGAIDITMNPAGTYTFTWSNGSADEDIDSLSAGIYSVSVVDSNGCVVVYEDTIQAPGGPLTAFLAVQNIACFGDTTGSIDLQVGGGTLPYTYSWDTGSTDEDIDSLLSGTYSVLITDSNGCTLQSSASINAPSSPLTVTLTVTDVLCGGDSTGAVMASVTGGTPGYSGVWSNGSADTMIVLVPAGMYTYTVADTNGCITIASDTVMDVNPALIPAITIVQPNCLTNTIGSISLSVTGGVTPYSFNWNTGDTTSVLDSLAAGLYIATVTDANGCTIDRSFILADSSAIGFVISGDSIICTGDSIILQADLYTGVTYQWYENGVALPAGTGSQLIVTTTGSYSLEAISGCGTFTDGPLTITVNPLPIVDAGADHTIACDSLLLLTATGATDYNWSPANLCLPPDVAATLVNPQVTTWFIVTGTDINGCSATDSVLVTVSCDTLFVPSGFSPNGDNVNDYFVISQLDKYPNAVLKIFNRWGALVYEKEKYDNSWNGLSNSDLIRLGEELPDGTYYYILDLKDGNEPLQGFVVLRR